MQQQLNTYRKEGKLAIRHMWIVVLVSLCVLLVAAELTWAQIFTAADVFASVVVADFNVKSINGYEGAAFAAIWSAFLQLFFAFVGSKVIFSSQPSPPLMVGFLLGLAAMAAQLFFMLTCWYLALGVQAAQNGWSKNLKIIIKCYKFIYFFFDYTFRYRCCK